MRGDQSAQVQHRRNGKKLAARLDAQAGIEYEGEDAPDYTHADNMAIKAWNYLNAGVGLQIGDVAAFLGIDDVGGLMERFYVLATHQTPKKE